MCPRILPKLVWNDSILFENPTLTLLQGNTEIIVNDDWQDAPNVTDLIAASGQVGAFALGEGSADAAALVTLETGAYTIQVSGVGNTSGVALVEIYEVVQP